MCPDGPSASYSSAFPLPPQTGRATTVPSNSSQTSEPLSRSRSLRLCTFQLPNQKSKSAWPSRGRPTPSPFDPFAAVVIPGLLSGSSAAACGLSWLGTMTTCAPFAMTTTLCRVTAKTPPGSAPSLPTTLPIALPIDRSSGRPLHRQIYDGYRDAIVARRLRAGDRIPSTRSLAAELGISRMPVLTAFEQLLAEGYFEARPGAGTFVASTLPDPRPAAAHPTTHATARDPSIHPARRPVSRRANLLVRPPDPWLAGWGSFRVSQPAVDRFPFEVWSALLARAARNPRASVLHY